ncbi:hypothetical protein FHU10_0846 [Serratia fonticola]|uniref:LarC family nickel insertion protein n=1 Tax=Serratia fonticola TaxID=47917 RepID=A0A542D758_SERFO|nr:LarC family nickel insertion protein [Serratia fonticola]TQI79090.1 hypothetical protein FHU09_1602 [Serratia fonticola]TQI98888.1 hypothetical protein FHU11_4448 [Serratia fonticola]TVZ68413.1 hypothetical protein FHU10_0846 [Serratia fonticola]
MHLHLDLTGGIAGDMFIAALLDAFPALDDPLQQMLINVASESPFRVRVTEGMNKGIRGKRFLVDIPSYVPITAPCQHHPVGILSRPHSHHHRSWREIRNYICQSSLSENVKQHALGIFGLLAQAEARVHNVNVEQVHFHEVGAWDCIADIISAAWLIAHCGSASWSVSKLPWGGGSVKCAHGVIPVPAPATLHLLAGYEFFDDGEAGERITPTGAAILAWLAPTQRIASGRLKAIGYGLGSRELVTRPNILRVTALEPTSLLQQEQIAIIQCDIDDMSGELLAIAREQLRALDEVLEITEHMGQGKKNRFISTLTLLCRPHHLDIVTTAVFKQTSTLGLRYWLCDRVSLDREQQQLSEHSVKIARRPDGNFTAKLEADHLHQCDNHQQRLQLKRNKEQQAEELANAHHRKD